MTDADMSETTYCLATNQPTNQPGTNLEIPEQYCSIRVTIKHSDFPIIHDKVLFDLEWYISYPHVGKNKDNEHYHILCPYGGTERLRKRIKDNFGNGNKFYSFKSLQNGLLSGIQYCSKEGSRPFIVGSSTNEWIACAPEWEHRNAAGLHTRLYEKRPRNPDHFKQLTHQNLIKSALRWRKDHGMKTKDLAVVLADMCEKGDYRPNISVTRMGVPSSWYVDFQKMCDGGTAFCEGRWNRMRIQEVWNDGGK